MGNGCRVDYIIHSNQLPFSILIFFFFLPSVIELCSINLRRPINRLRTINAEALKHRLRGIDWIRRSHGAIPPAPGVSAGIIPVRPGSNPAGSWTTYCRNVRPTSTPLSELRPSSLSALWLSPASLWPFITPRSSRNWGRWSWPRQRTTPVTSRVNLTSPSINKSWNKQIICRWFRQAAGNDALPSVPARAGSGRDTGRISRICQIQQPG